MKLLIAGGSGHLGRLLTRNFLGRGHRVTVLTRDTAGRDRSAPGLTYRSWNGQTLGPWATDVDGADVVINLAGRSVDCRYNTRNLREMFDSRIRSTRVVGDAISRAANPPAAWLQMSTATIYAHSFDVDNSETGAIGGDEPDVPDYWRFSIDIATQWESALSEADTPSTRKVALRSAMVMGPDPGGPFAVLSNLTRAGLGGAIGSGRQYMSWIHDRDFVRAVEFIIEHSEIHGPVNLAAPTPLPQREFIAALRRAWRVPIGLPTPVWLLKLGTFVLRTDSELILKSRRVVPGRLLGAQFSFEYPSWPEAADELVARRRSGNETPYGALAS